MINKYCGKKTTILSALSSVVINKPPVKRSPPKEKRSAKVAESKIIILMYHSCGKKYSRRDLVGYDHCSKRMHKS